MIEEKRIKDYWKERAGRQGRRTVGFVGTPLEKEDKRYAKRKKLIFSLCPRNLQTLDYGCGVGRYAPDFEKYTGADITTQLLELAREDNPGKTFVQLQEPWLPAEGLPKIELFFTATVLQHNSDEVVARILASVKPHAAPGIRFSLYENAQVVTDHVKARSPQDYADMVAVLFKVKRVRSKCHKIHKEKHCCALIETE